MTKISGEIKYEMQIVDGVWELKYTQSADNDLAVMAIGRQLMEWSEEKFEEKIKEKDISTSDKKFFKDRLTKVRVAKFGLELMCSFLLATLNEWKMQLAKANNQAPADVTPEEHKAIMEMMNKVGGKA